jgi:hypothetical protein
MGLAWKFFLPMTLMNIIAAALWVWYPFPAGLLLSAALLLVSGWLLIRANNPAPLQPRTYILAD